MEAKDFYVVRYPGGKFASKSGKEPTTFLAEAKRYSSEADARSAAGDGAAGVSLYGHDNGRPAPLRHMPLHQGKPDSTKPAA